jgi:hypothetical protein
MGKSGWVQHWIQDSIGYCGFVNKNAEYSGSIRIQIFLLGN